VSRSYTIGQLALEAGVSVETIRYYQRRELFPEPKRPPTGSRRYGAADVERLRFIKRAQRSGFTLGEIEQLAGLLKPMSCSKTRRIAAAKLDVIDQRITELRSLRGELARLVAACEINTDESRCPIIENFVSAAAGN
jgi:MerR family mercuric resistance operon transcriptional regulator